MSRKPRETNRRRHARVRVTNLVGYAENNSGRGFFTLLGSAVTVDLSESGIRIRTIEPLPIGSNLTFDLKLGGEVHRVQGRVIWGEELEQDRAYEFGVRFFEVDEAALKKLRIYVSAKQAQKDE
ncbi:MAG TPA: PilZ domain-containing protein [Planctomycetota bacterium]|nr:PilZ domain-containing protein [Planctomycetota bacterium]